MEHQCNYTKVSYDGEEYVYTCTEGCTLITEYGTIPIKVSL